MIRYVVQAVIIKPIQGVFNVCKFIRHPLLGVADIAVKRRWYGVHDWLLRHHEDQHRVAALQVIESHIESYPDTWVWYNEWKSPGGNTYRKAFICEALGLLLWDDKWYDTPLLAYDGHRMVVMPHAWPDRIRNCFHDLTKRQKAKERQAIIDAQIAFSKTIVNNVKEHLAEKNPVPLLSDLTSAITCSEIKTDKLEDEFKPTREDCVETISQASVALLAVSKRDEGKAVQSRPSTGARNRVRKPMERRKKLYRVGMFY